MNRPGFLLAHSLFSGMILVNLKKKKSKEEPELKHKTVYYVSANYSDFTKQSIVCVCLLIQTSLVNSGQKKHMQTDVSSPPPLSHPLPVVFLLLLYFFVQFFFLGCFVLSFASILPSKRQWISFKIPNIGLTGLSLAIYSLGQVIESFGSSIFIFLIFKQQ